MFPVRCFTCGKVLDPLLTTFHQRVRELQDMPGLPIEHHDGVVSIMHDLGIYAICCKSVALTSVDDSDAQLAQSNTPGELAGTVHINRGRKRSVPTEYIAR